MDINTAFENIVRLFTDITAIPFAVGFVIVVTQLLKTALKLEGNRAALVALVVQALVWVGYSVAKANGLEAQFEQGLKGIETLIGSLVSVLFPAILSALATKSVYDRVSDKQVAGFRKPQTPKAV